MEFNEKKEGRFPFGKQERKKEVENKSKETRRKQFFGKPSVLASWSWQNSNLTGEGPSFESTFDRLIPEIEGRKDLRSFIEERLADKKGKAVGIEFGGPGSNVFGQFSDGFFKKSAGVTLADIRTYFFSDTIANDVERRHSVIEGDMFSNSTYEQLHQWLEGDSLDLILERMESGRDLAPVEPYTQARVLQTWYALLADKGLMFVQLPYEMRPLLKPWERVVRDNAQGKIDLKIDDVSGTVFFLQKLPGAPRVLPMLDPRQVRSISKQ